MEIRYPSLEAIHPLSETPVPANLKKKLTEWATVQHRKYNFGYVLGQELFHKDYRIYLYQASIGKPVCLHLVVHKPVIALQFMQTGSIHWQPRDAGEELLPCGSFGLLYLPTGAHDIWFEKGEYTFTYITLPPSWLEDLADSFPSIQTLLHSLQQASTKSAAALRTHIGFKGQGYLNRLITSTKKGGHLHQDMKGCILELLNLYADEMNMLDIIEQQDHIVCKEELTGLRHRISKEPNIHDYRLKKITYEYGLPAAIIRKTFKQLFGVSLSDYTQQQCMEKAKFLLLTTNYSIDAIAMELGYDNVSNFSKAFRQYFNSLPRDFRRM